MGRKIIAVNVVLFVVVEAVKWLLVLRWWLMCRRSRMRPLR